MPFAMSSGKLCFILKIETMSDMSTLRNNIELILHHREEIQNYSPYKFSRLVIRNPRRVAGSWYGQNMYMGAYVDMWHKYLQMGFESPVLPIYIASGMFGAMYKFLGLSLPDKALVKEVPIGKMSTHYMRTPMWEFIQANPVRGLGVPLSQLVEEIKEGKPLEERESYQVYTLREEFYRAVSAVSGVPHEGELDLSYKLEQSVNYELRIYVNATVLLDLSVEEKKELVFGGSAVELQDMVTKTKEDLAVIAKAAGFPDYWVENSRTNWAIIKYAQKISSIDDVLKTETITSVSEMLHAMRKRIRRL